jgi:hypothetical protein
MQLCRLRNYTYVNSLKVENILKVKKALVKSVCYVIKHTICKHVYIAH